MHDIRFDAAVLVLLAVLPESGCGNLHPPRTDYMPLGPACHAPFSPTALTRVAVVAPANFTLPGEAVVRLEGPLTGALIIGIRNRCAFELVPGHLAGSRTFLEETRAWYRRPRRAPFPAGAFETLVSENPADAYLLVWLDRSSRPWLVDTDLHRVAANRLLVQSTALLFMPSGKVAWAVTSSTDTAFVPGGLADVARAEVHAIVDGIVRALVSEPAGSLRREGWRRSRTGCASSPSGTGRPGAGRLGS